MSIPELSRESPHPSSSESRPLRIRRVIDLAIRWLRHCAVCGAHSSPLGSPIDLLCPRCEQKLAEIVNQKENLRQPGYPFPVYSLFTWTDDNDRWLRPVLYALKGGRQVRFLTRWLVHLSYLRTLHSANPYRPLITLPPRPSTLFGQPARDHGWMIGQLLAAIWQTTTYEGLRRRAEPAAVKGPAGWLLRARPHQKLKTRGERFQMRFDALGEMKEFQGIRTVVFTDDVITTGATALAAYMALEDPHSFEVWTLVCRPKLALNPRV